MGTILLVRHGQASFGATDYDVLSPRGELQARRLGAALGARRVTPSQVVAGSLVRQQATAVAIRQAAGWSSEVNTESAWDEFAHEGLIRLVAGHVPTTPADYQDALESAMRRWSVQGTGTAESFTDFSARVRGAIRDLADDLESGELAIVVTSAGVISWLAASLLDAGVEQWLLLNRVCVNTGMTTVASGRRGLSILTFNEHSHLCSDEITYR